MLPLFDSFLQDIFEILTAAKVKLEFLESLNPFISEVQKSMTNICKLSSFLR